MKRLCFGTVYRILYKYRGQKVTLESLLDAIATSFNVELGNNDSSYAGHLKSGKNGFAKADIDAFRSTTAIPMLCAYIFLIRQCPSQSDNDYPHKDNEIPTNPTITPQR